MKPAPVQAAVDNFARNVRGRNNAAPAAASEPMFSDTHRRHCFTTGLELVSLPNLRVASTGDQQPVKRGDVLQS